MSRSSTAGADRWACRGDWFSSVGFDRTSGMAWAGGYVGDGVAASNLAGRTLAALITGADDDELTTLPWVQHRSPNWEPEPLRWLGVRAATRLTAGLDRSESRHGRTPRTARQVGEQAAAASGSGRCSGERPVTDVTTSSDAALVVAIGRYDEAALAELFRRHGRTVLSLATRVLRDASVAEEVMQDVFVRLWHHPERFDPERGELRSFLLRESHSRAVDRIRSEAARSRREERHESSAGPTRQGDDIERQVWELIRGETVKSALGQLSDGERDAITLAYFGGYTYREVATMLQVPEGTVKGRIRVGLQKLAGRLEAAGLGGGHG